MPVIRLVLSASVVKALPVPASGRQTYVDLRCPVLQLVCSSAGSRVWYRYARVNGRPTRSKLGAWPQLSVDQVRRACDRIAGELAAGRNPFEDSAKAKRRLTLLQFFERYLETYAKPHKRTWQRDEARFGQYLSAWAKRPAIGITRAEVRELHARIAAEKRGRAHGGSYAANHVLELLRAIFAHAIRDGLASINPATDIRKHAVHSRERFLTPDEMTAFFRGLALVNERARDLFMVALFTGARRSNVLAMRWADLDLAAGTWTVRGSESKNKLPMTIALAPIVVQILEKRRPFIGCTEWVFPGNKQGRTGHLSDPRAAWKRVLKAAGISDLRIHDLRRTLGSWQAAGGSSLLVIGKSLGHKSTSATAIYARLQLDPVRQSVTAAIESMLAAVRIDGTPDVPSNNFLEKS